MSIKDEYIPPCFMCGKIWKRKEYKNWYFFNGDVVCKEHKGSTEWYKAVLDLNKAKCELKKMKLKEEINNLKKLFEYLQTDVYGVELKMNGTGKIDISKIYKT